MAEDTLKWLNDREGKQIPDAFQLRFAGHTLATRANNTIKKSRIVLGIYCNIYTL